MPRKTQRRRIDFGRKANMYCRNIDGMGYCCTSPAMPDRLLCETHVTATGQVLMSPLSLTEAPYIRTSGIGVSPLTAAASEAALKNMKDVPLSPFTGFIPATPSSTTNPMLSGPPPPVKLEDQISASPFFKNLADHFGTDAWVNLLKGSVQVRGNEYSKKLAEYISAQIGINPQSVTDLLSDGSNVQLLSAAGVKLMFLVCELLAREALWDRIPYIRYVLSQKHREGTAEHIKAKHALIDTLSLFDENEPRVFGETYPGLFYIAQQALQGKAPRDLYAYPLPSGAIPRMTPKEIVADLMRGMVARATGLPDPNIDDPPTVAATMVSNLKEVDAKYKCAEKGVGTITEACWAWIDQKAGPVVEAASLAEYVETARKLMPAFVAVFN